ncbi:MAG: hypothetical protein HQ481_21685 [Alphaproteobacteria bacterium]|nr:hypothetical protein [Alphaproteobacteria bacterium]
MRRLFTEHPAAVGESYLEHMGMAFGFGGRMVLTGLACLVHGILPFAFVKTGSRAITELHTRMVTHRDRRADAPVREDAPNRATA